MSRYAAITQNFNHDHDDLGEGNHTRRTRISAPDECGAAISAW
jgi:hypothetical protein